MPTNSTKNTKQKKAPMVDRPAYCRLLGRNNSLGLHLGTHTQAFGVRLSIKKAP
jgi:hypothetical protein